MRPAWTLLLSASLSLGMFFTSATARAANNSAIGSEPPAPPYSIGPDDAEAAASDPARLAVLDSSFDLGTMPSSPPPVDDAIQGPPYSEGPPPPATEPGPRRRAGRAAFHGPDALWRNVGRA